MYYATAITTTTMTGTSTSTKMDTPLSASSSPRLPTASPEVTPKLSTAPNTTPSGKTPDAITTGSGGVVAGVLVAVVLAIGAGWWYWGHGCSQRTRQQRQQQRAAQNDFVLREASRNTVSMEMNPLSAAGAAAAAETQSPPADTPEVYYSEIADDIEAAEGALNVNNSAAGAGASQVYATYSTAAAAARTYSAPTSSQIYVAPVDDVVAAEYAASSTNLPASAMYAPSIENGGVAYASSNRFGSSALYANSSADASAPKRGGRRTARGSQQHDQGGSHA